MKQDWKKSEKSLYIPKPVPSLIKVPPFRFFTIKGAGNPNNEFFGDYITVLYSLSYSVKMSPKNGTDPDGYYDYTVYPLEGIWDISEDAKKAGMQKLEKDELVFNLMIRQPDFVTEEYAMETIERVAKKKPHHLIQQVKFEVIEDGECIQMLHTGPYDNEPESFRQMEEYCIQNSYERESMIHREIYLSDARKVSPEKLRTVLRFKVKKQ